MSENHEPVTGPDFADGVPLASIGDGAIVSGHVQGEPAILVRQGDELFALAAFCTHYGGPLAEGLLVDETIRCPWHHACFSLRTGAILRPPALDPLQRWRVEVRQGLALATQRLEAVEPRTRAASDALSSIVIVGGGVAGYTAAATLRREGYPGLITMLSADAALPCDRPNLSKDYLAGKAPEEWTLLRPAEFYTNNQIDVRLNCRVARIDADNRQVETEAGQCFSYDSLLLATGAEPVRLEVPGAHLPHVHYLRTLADSRAIGVASQKARRAVVIGASFIGLEVASSLRARGVAVDVVAPDRIPMQRILGPEVGQFLRSVHEAHGVTFHLENTVFLIGEDGVRLDSGEWLEADLVVVGIGVRPATGLATEAGLEVDGGVVVDDFLETSTPGIFAAGDIARWPDLLSGHRIRVEHFVVAERQGQTAARNILGNRERYTAVPFFWTEQYDLGLAYVGHAENWDEAQIDGKLEDRDCSITYRKGGEKLAVATIHRDLAGLREEVEFERRLTAILDNGDSAAARQAERV